MAGDAADDMFDAACRDAAIHDAMTSHGCKPCPRLSLHRRDKGECPVCFNMNWLDKDGQPCES